MIGMPTVLAASLALTPSNTRVVIAQEAPKTVRYAAAEMATFLSQSFGVTVPVATEPAPRGTSVILGDNAWSRAAGIDVAALPRDGYVIRADAASSDGSARVYVCGRDDPEIDMKAMVLGGYKGSKRHEYERATYFGVLEFLERYVGCRFYFPGELGTVVPARTSVDVPCGTLADAPDFTTRRFSSWRKSIGEWHEKLMPDDFGTVLNTYKYRLRYETEKVSCCHGQFQGHLAERFGEAHPEWLRMDERGKRPLFLPKAKGATCNKSQLCQSSGVWEEIYRDAKAFFTGADVASRGIPSRYGGLADHWPSGLCGADSRGKWFDVMPNDGFAECRCPACQAAYDKGDTCDYATALVWGRTVELARRLKAEGIPGRLTQMAYRPYRKVPAIDIPENVDVMVSESGPWAMASPWKVKRDNAEVKAWHDKLGRKVSLWNYTCKIGKRRLPGVPAVCPRAYGAYYKSVAPWTYGAYAESETDRLIFNYLNLYVFMKVSWNNETDVDALLAEHNRLMFGPAADEMGRITDLLEEKWTKGVVGTFEDGPKGPVLKVPPEDELKAKVYTDAFLGELKALFDAAAAKVAPDSLEARRIAMLRREYLGGLRRFCGLPEEPKPVVSDAKCPIRWVHVSNSLTSEALFARMSNLVEVAAASGFNGLLWASGVDGEGFDFHRWNDRRRDRLQRIRTLCERNGLEIVPLLWSVGRAHALLDYDINLGEGLPLKDVPYVCTGEKAVFAPEEKTAAWAGPAFPEVARVEIRPGDAPGTFRRRGIVRYVKTRSFRRYRVMAKIRSENVDADRLTVRTACSLSAAFAHGGRAYGSSRESFNRRPGDFGWEDVCFDFVTSTNDEEEIAFGLNYRGQRGFGELKDVTVRPLGLQKLVRRDGAPVVVKDAESGRVYVEGRDWRLRGKSTATPERADDPDLELDIPKGSAIRPGERLLVSAYALARRSNGQATACMANEALYDYCEKSMDAAVSLFGKNRRWFLPMDEIRAGGTCESCRGKGLGNLLADCLRRQVEIIRKRVPDAEIYAWPDMFDPYANAKPSSAGRDYALCCGSFAPISDKVPADIVPVVWSDERSMVAEMAHFNGLGRPTVYAGYYDVFTAECFRGVGSMREMQKAKDCRGYVFTTWTPDGKYDLLPAYGEALRRIFGTDK